MNRKSSILTEVGWLAYFLVVFVALVVAFNALVVPHHFNPMIAVVFAAFLAAMIMIATRAWLRTRTG
jgi:hypothetical protein